MFGADVASFRLHLAENKAERTIRAYTEAVRWFAAAHLLCQTSRTRWEQVDTQDVQRWMVHLLGRYSEAYAYQQYRALQQFFRWLAAEEELRGCGACQPGGLGEQLLPLCHLREHAGLQNSRGAPPPGSGGQLDAASGLLAAARIARDGRCRDASQAGNWYLAVHLVSHIRAFLSLSAREKKRNRK